jgi:hypothetical protein
MFSCKELADVLTRGARRARNELVIPTDELMKVLEAEAKGYIGEYQAGWKPLAASTVEEKTRLGYAPPDNPLLREGIMRDSIEHASAPAYYGADGAIGSNDPVALWQEMGTSRGIPPRSFLGLAMSRSEEPATPLFGEFAVSLLVP